MHALSRPRAVPEPGAGRMLRSPAALPLVLLTFFVAALCSPSSARADVDVTCHVEFLAPIAGDDLGGRFIFHVEPVAEEPYELESVLLLLDREGEILQEIPIADGDAFQLAVRDRLLVRENVDGMDWLLHAPGFLFRNRIQKGFDAQFAYCSPFAAIRVDQPEDLTFVKTTADEFATASLLIGVASMDPATIRIAIDCVDILEPLGAVFPGGPFSGVVEIAGEMVTIENLIHDPVHGTIEFDALGLPGGAHLVQVSGLPDYMAEIEPGALKWQRPLGTLLHERTLSIFSVDITSPADGAQLPLGPVTFTGTIRHSEPPTSLRLHGLDLPLPPAVFVSGDGCVGDAWVVDFSAELPAANVVQDLGTGDDSASALDPGVNFVSALATDAAGHVPNDRVRILLGDVQAGLSVPDAQARRVELERYGTAEEHCVPQAVVPGMLANGFGVSLSETALAEAIRAKVLPDAVSELQTSLNSLIGTAVEAQMDPCLAASPAADPLRRINYRGELYTAEELDALLLEESTEESEPTITPRRLGLSQQPGDAVLNDPPDLAPIENKVTQTNQLVVVVLSATDPDDDPLTYFGESLPANSHVDGNRFEFHPACDQVGDHSVTVGASDGTDVDYETFTVTVNAVDVPDTYNAEFVSVNFNPDNVTLDLRFAAADRIEIVVNTGPLVFGMHAGDCYGDCLLGCCLSWGVDFDVLMDDIELTTSITPQQLLCGVADPNEIPEPDVVVAGLDVHFSDIDIGGVFGWLTPGALTVQILDLFGVPELLLNLFASDYIVDQLDASLEQSIVNQFPGFTFSGLREMNFSSDLPVGVPLALQTAFSDLPVVVPDQNVSMGIHTAFLATAPLDPVPPWYPTASGIPHVGPLGGDFLLATSDDALNQMMAELVATGVFRERFEGFTVGDFVAGFSLPLLGIDSSTPVLITVDVAQDDVGNAVPPIIGFIDDPVTTEVVEMKIRTQLTTRAILPRGGAVADDRTVCSCLSYSCSDACLLVESVLRLNFLIDLSLSELIPGLLVQIGMTVSEVQELEREEGFDSFEASDFRNDEDHIVQTSATSPLLAMLRDQINASMPPLLIPPEALTLNGWVEPTNPRLFAVTVDDAGVGTQDYFGLMADVVVASSAVAPPSAMALLQANRPLVGDLAPDAQSEPLETTVDARQAVVIARPNPFNPRTVIYARLNAPGPWQLDIYNVAGKLVRSFEGDAPSPLVQVPWDGTDHSGQGVAAGAYLFHLQAPGTQASGKLTLVK